MDEPGNDGASMSLADSGAERLQLRYAGSARAIDYNTRTVLDAWGETARDFVSGFDEEMLFEGAAGSHWIAVTGEIARRVRSEPGAAYHLLVRYVGNVGPGDARRWLFAGIECERAAVTRPGFPEPPAADPASPIPPLAE
jgi:hypothetical protein